MKKISFLAKLHKESKLQLVAPSEAIKDSYIAKSDSNLASAKILLDNGRLEEAVALTYYSRYHMLTALLFKTGIKCENHAASIILLKAVFGMDDRDISSAKGERIDKQYYTDFRIMKDDVMEAVETAEEFNKRLLDFISKLSNQKIDECRRTFLSMI